MKKFQQGNVIDDLTSNREDRDGGQLAVALPTDAARDDVPTRSDYLECTGNKHQELDMPKLSGQCLCGAITFSGDVDIKVAGNCHCRDCRAITGAAYATLLFVAADDLNVQGRTRMFQHTADSGAALEKHFCPTCGSQLFGTNSNRPGVLSVRAGVINETELVKPSFNVFLDSKIASTPVDPQLKGFAKMPGA